MRVHYFENGVSGTLLTCNKQKMFVSLLILTCSGAVKKKLAL